ncbi:MAG: hypothetical protein KKE50_04055 [Nanoarchaeota archaeon]|nr:hypothetical protein [Nanoarchaeota archaeon]
MEATREFKSSELERKSFIGRVINHVSRHKMIYGVVAGFLSGAVLGYCITSQDATSIQYLQNMAGLGVFGGVAVPAAISVGEHFSGSVFSS